MTPHHTLTHFAGLDWAKNHHHIVVVDVSGNIVAEFRIDRPRH